MMFVLYRKLLRDIRWPLFACCLLMGLFAGLWVRVTVQVTTQISPFLGLLAMKSGFGPTFVMDLFFRGPGKLIQTFFGGESIEFVDPQETLSIGPMHPLVQAILCIWAIGRAAGAIAGEIDRGTMELLLAQPIARARIVLTHFLIDLTVIPILCASFLVGLHIGTAIVGTFTVDPGVYEAVRIKPPNPLPSYTLDPAKVYSGMWNAVALAFAVSGYTMWISSAGRSRVRALGLAIFLTLLQFLVNVIGQLWDGVAFLRPLSVFYYYQPQAINLRHVWWVDPGMLWGGKPLVSLNVIAVLGLVGAFGYLMALRTFIRRDVPAPL